MYAKYVRDRGGPPNYSHVALVEVSEWLGRRFTLDTLYNYLGRVRSALHRHLCHTWQRAPLFIIENCQVPHNENLRMARKCQVRIYFETPQFVQGRSCAFRQNLSQWRSGDPGCPQHGLGANRVSCIPRLEGHAVP